MAAENTLFTNTAGREAYVCHEWFLDFWIVKVYNLSISLMINIVNTVIKLILVNLIQVIGEDTRSATNRSVKMGVFVTQFFNTGILILLSSANFQYTNVPILNQYLRGQYTDFTSDWYKDVGAIIVKAMLIASIMPVVEFFISYGKLSVFRLLDRGFSKNVFNSKKKSIQQYADVYSGPEYMMHFRFSTIMNIAFVTLTYGTALPILYPIALWSYFVLFTFERVVICYYYKQPPAFDEKMTISALDMLTWVPIPFMMFAYWFLGNNQLFNNILFKQSLVNDIVQTGHTVVSEFQQLSYDQSIPPLVFLVFFAVTIPATKFITSLIEAAKPGYFDI